MLLCGYSAFYYGRAFEPFDDMIQTGCEQIESAITTVVSLCAESRYGPGYTLSSTLEKGSCWFFNYFHVEEPVIAEALVGRLQWKRFLLVLQLFSC